MMICDCVTELGIVALAGFFLLGLQMKAKEKVTVGFAFAWRLP